MEDVDEEEDEEEVVVLGDAGCAVMRAGAGLWAAAASAVAPAGRMEGMSSGRKFGSGWLGGPGRDQAAWRADSVGSGGGWRRRAAVSAFWAWLGWGPAMREGVWVGVRGGKQVAWAAFRCRGGCAWVFGGVCGERVRVTGRVWVCRGAWGSLQWVCAGCWVCRLVRVVQQEGLWRACVVVWAGGGGLCRGAWGCTRWWACVALRLGSGGGGQ